MNFVSTSGSLSAPPTEYRVRGHRTAFAREGERGGGAEVVETVVVGELDTLAHGSCGEEPHACLVGLRVAPLLRLAVGCARLEEGAGGQVKVKI